MLPRVLEPEAMDTLDEAREYDAMDHSPTNTAFVGAFLAAHGPCRGGAVLDVGTGPARIPIALARADARAPILGIDLARHMLDRARRNVEEAGLSDRVKLQLADAKGVPYPDGQFEAVISNSIVHHIPEPSAALAEMVRLVAPGGTLFVRDLRRPDDGPSLAAIVRAYASEESESARALFSASLRAALTASTISGRSWRPLGLSAGDDVVRRPDRHWTWTWRRPNDDD